jgi:hypothetical protein
MANVLQGEWSPLQASVLPSFQSVTEANVDVPTDVDESMALTIDD